MESQYLDLISANQIELHFRSIFLQGLLLMNVKQIPSYFDPWNDALLKWHEWLDNQKMTALEGCLSFVSSNCRSIDSIVCGFQSVNQLKEFQNIRANLSSHPLSPPDFINPCENIGLIDPRKWAIN